MHSINSIIIFKINYIINFPTNVFCKSRHLFIARGGDFVDTTPNYLLIISEVDACFQVPVFKKSSKPKSRIQILIRIF